MKKLQDLRSYLQSKIPELARGPDRLLTFVEDGKITVFPGDNYSHKYIMPVVIIVTDWAHSTDDIILPVIEWLMVREPGFDPEESIKFEAEIIDKEKVDIRLDINITERVIVTFENGQRTIEHVLPDPPLYIDEDASLSMTATGPGGDEVNTGG